VQAYDVLFQITVFDAFQYGFNLFACHVVGSPQMGWKIREGFYTISRQTRNKHPFSDGYYLAGYSRMDRLVIVSLDSPAYNHQPTPR
jgi:hypothetical protein